MVDEIFKPTKKMRDLIKVMLDPEVKPTITAFCSGASINRQTYYNWFDNPVFVEWFNKEWDMAMAKQVSWLDRVGLTKSVVDFRYWEAMQMKYGKFKRKIDQTSDDKPINPGIDLSKLDKDELLKLAELADKATD